MATKPQKTRLMPMIGTGSLAIAGALAFALTVERGDGSSQYMGLTGGAARLVARKLTTIAGETAGAWHHHPGYAYNVVTEGTVIV